MSATFRSLSSYNYRVWAAGALVSNVGTWMQRTAQDWVVLTQLTHNDALAVGITMAFQFGPPILLLPVTGLVADRFDRRHVLMVTQTVMGILALGLAVLTLSGALQLWQVYGFALLLGCAAAFDAPARQTFVSDLVAGPNITNAVALNSASFNAARTIGPAVAGLLVAAVGAGAVFAINAVSFAAVLVALKLLHKTELHVKKRAPNARGDFIGGFKYLKKRPDIIVILVMIFIIGTFGLNFPIFISTMAKIGFGTGAGEFGVLSSALAIGSVSGALLAARREKPWMGMISVGAALFGVGCVAAALAPGYWTFAIALTFIGVVSQTMMTATNGTVQLTTDPAIRGRVMAIYMAVFMGGTPIGAPIVGWVANEFGPRWGLGVAAAAGFVAAAVGVTYLVRKRHFRIGRNEGRWAVTYDDLAVEAV